MGCRVVVAIDPGDTTGWAIFWDGALFEAGCTTKLPRDLPDVPLLPASLVVEIPVIYPMGRGKGDSNDLIKLAELAGMIRGWYLSRAPGLVTATVAPRTWKGTVPKKIHNARVLDKLTSKERAILPMRPRAKDYDHNMVDALGIGLWQLQTMGTR